MQKTIQAIQRIGAHNGLRPFAVSKMLVLFFCLISTLCLYEGIAKAQKPERISILDWQKQPAQLRTYTLFPKGELKLLKTTTLPNLLPEKRTPGTKAGFVYDFQIWVEDTVLSPDGHYLACHYLGDQFHGRYQISILDIRSQREVHTLSVGNVIWVSWKNSKVLSFNEIREEFKISSNEYHLESKQVVVTKQFTRGTEPESDYEIKARKASLAFDIVEQKLNGDPHAHGIDNEGIYGLDDLGRYRGTSRGVVSDDGRLAVTGPFFAKKWKNRRVFIILKDLKYFGEVEVGDVSTRQFRFARNLLFIAVEQKAKRCIQIWSLNPVKKLREIPGNRLVDEN